MLDKNLQRVKISQVIGSQLPDFVAEDNPLFVDFLKQYYTSQEYQGGPTDISENIDKYLNLENFQEENYLNTTTKLNGDIAYYDDVITVDSTDSWPNQYGLLKIDNEIITYTGKTSTTFTGCVRGFSGIDNLHKTNDPEFLVFSTSSAEDHTDNSTVINLSNLFLQEFWKNLKTQFLPGFENRKLADGLNQSFFLSRAKDFYASKGTDEALKILFKVLYADEVKIIKPQDFIAKPSNADWLVTKNLIVERVSGNPLNLLGQTLLQDSPTASGQIYSIELYSLEGNSYYLIKLSDDSLVGQFQLNGFTKNTIPVSPNSTIITVDSTLGFDDVGELYVDGQVISYSSKSSNQFLNCSGILDAIPLYSGIHQNKFAYSYENGNLEDKVELRITGTLSNFDLETSDNRYLSVNDEIPVKTLGQNLERGSYNGKYDHWIYNTINEIELVDSIDKFTSINSPTFVTTKNYHRLNRGDNVSLVTSGNLEISGTVTDILYNNATDRINNNSKRFEFTFDGTLDKNLFYTLRRNILTANSNTNPSISGYFADVQNTYIDDSRENLYVTSSSLPSYEITTTDGSVQFTAGESTDLITTAGAHNFYTGQKIYLSTISGSLSGIFTNSTYFVKRISFNSFKLSFNSSGIDNGFFITFSGTGTHKVTPFDTYNKSLQDQKLLKKIPIFPRAKSSNSIKDTSTVGLFVNGVEIRSNRSGDSVYYGQLKSIDVLNPGSDYNVIIPPTVTITDQKGQGAKANACMTGGIEKIIVTNAGYDFDEIPEITITGGNGKNATAEARLKSVQFSINFNGGTSGVNTTSNTIGFTTYHTFKTGDEVIYKSYNNPEIGIGITENSNAVDSYLVSNSIYIVKVVNDTTIQLMNKLDDARVGINTILLNRASSGTHGFIAKNNRKVIDFIQVTNSGEGYQNRPIEVDSIAYPPVFPGISTALVGINTVDNYIFAQGHGFETGEEITYTTTGSVISGLSTQKSYYAVKIDESKFKLVEKIVGVSTITGIATTAFNQNVLDNNYIDLNSFGSGTHIFNYPPIKVSIGGIVKTDQFFGQPSAEVVCVGSIKSVFLKNGGNNYGSEVLNYNRFPEISVSSGSGALLRPIVVNGSINSVYVLEGGSGYISNPEIIINGEGKYAKLVANVSNGSIDSIQVLDGGKDYIQNTTTIEVKTLGKNARLFGNIQEWKVNSFYKYSFGDDDGAIIGSFDETLGNQFVSVYAPKKLRKKLNDNLDSGLNEIGINTAHSPIIGWCYDGNPIYGPYGASSPYNLESPRLMKSGYSQILKQNRPSIGEFPLGFFVEDFEYTEDGDLDEYNGRFCTTPEFPGGTYAYFATRQDFPYVVNNFKNEVSDFNFNLLNNQKSSILNSGTLSRNITPYRLTDSNVAYNGLNSIGNKREKFVIDSIYTSGISTVGIISSGINYKVGESIIFDDAGTDGRGATARVELIEGKNINSITYTESKINDVSFHYSTNIVTGITSMPHNLSDGDLITVSGINDTTFKFFEGSHRISVSTIESTLKKQVPDVIQTGIVTTIQLFESPASGRFSTNSIIKINSEQMLILNTYEDSELYRVQRGYDSPTSTHNVGDKVSINQKEFSYRVNDVKVNKVIRKNRVTYFDPTSSVGLGTQGTKYFIGYGVSFTSVGIATGTTTRIFFNSHSFQPSEFVQIIGGSPAGINTNEARVTSVGSTFINIEFNSSALTSVGNTSTVLLKKYNFVGSKSIYIPSLSCGCESFPFQTFEPFIYSSNVGFGLSVSEYDDLSKVFGLQDGQIVYVTRLSEASDTIGIRTTRTGIGSLSTLNIVGIGTTTGINHSLITLNEVVSGDINKYGSVIVTDSAHNINTNETINLTVTPNRKENVKVKYDESSNKLVINPVSFASTAIGVGTTVSTLYLPNHKFKNGDKVIYHASNAASPLVDGNHYYVIKYNNDRIKLANTYSDTLKTPPVNVAITTTGSGTHEISLINPRIEITRGNNIGFGVSDLSLNNFKLKLYLDQQFENEYLDSSLIQIGTSGDNNSSTEVSLKTSDKTPQVLYYQLVQTNLTDGSTYKIGVDKDVKDFSKIIINESVYNGEFSVTGIGTTELKINASFKPEHDNYTNSNTSILKYNTNSTSTSGGIAKIKILFEGVSYKKLPQIVSVDSQNGTGAVLRAYSNDIGKIKNTSPLNIGYNYSADKTIVPKAELPTILILKNNYTIDNVGVSSGGSGYLVPPTPIVLENPNIILKSSLSGTSVAKVNIEILDGNLSEIPPTIVSTKNSNGVLITNAESDGTFNTLTLKRPINGFKNFPFIVGDKIFVEGVILSEPLSNGGGYNSSDYNYQTFEVTNLINDSTVSSLTYRMPVGFGTTGGKFDAINSIARVINDKDLAKFSAVVKQQNFDNDEQISSSNGASGRVIANGWDSKNNTLKLNNISGKFSPNSVIVGSNSKTKASIVNVTTFDGKFKVDSFVRKNNGWQDRSGILNDSFQRIHDSFYYQNFSYSIKSKTPYSTWEEPVNSLAHPSGFKAFSELDIFSRSAEKAQVSIASSNISLLIDIDSVISMYTRSAFDVGSEETNPQGISRFIKTNNKKLINYTKASTNKSIAIDDISSQFNGITSTTGGNIVGLNSFRLLNNNKPILHTEFDSTNSSIISPNQSLIVIPNHNFNTGEKLIYNPGPGGTSIGIATTDRTFTGVSTDLLPSEVYAYRVNSSQIKLSGIKTDSTVNNIFFEFRATSGSNVAIGKTHQLSVDSDLANSRALITIDNIIQSPIYRKNISVGLSTSVGIGSTIISLQSTKGIETNTLLRIENEILKVGVVGFGTTSDVTVFRGQLNTVAAGHTVGAAITVLGGDYTISNGYIYFTTPPYGPVGFSTLQPGITTNSTFTGRIFYKKDYSKNYIFDDISDQFTGNVSTGKTFVLKSDQNNITGISTFNGIVLINNIFQRPIGEDATTDYELFDDGVSGITTISFTGSTTETIPKGGVINNIEVGVGTGYTGGSYSNLSLKGGSGSGATIDIVVGVGGSILTYELKNRGIGYEQNDILYFNNLNPVGLNSATIKVNSVYTNKFSGWTFGELIKINDFSNQFNGTKKTFTLFRTVSNIAQPYSIEKDTGSDIELQNNLLVFINDFLQIPGRDYFFTGGTQLIFSEAPPTGAKSKVLYYQGSTGDVISESPIQTIKVGDTLKLESNSEISAQLNRIVTEIISSDKVQTNDYNDIGISTDAQFTRKITWTKQTSDLIIDGEIISKNRTNLEPKIKPTTRLIKDFVPGDTAIYVKNAFPDFNIIDDIEESRNNVIVLNDVQTSTAKVNVSTVSAAGTITGLNIVSGGVGYLQTPTIEFYSTSQIKEIGKTWSVGIVTNTSVTIKDIKYNPDKLLYVASDSSGGISTSTLLVTWNRFVPSFVGTNELNSIEYSSNVWVGVGSDGRVGYSTDNAATWNAGTIYTYNAESGGLGRFEYSVSNTTRRFNSVAYGNGKFVAVGTGGTVIISDDTYPTAGTWIFDGTLIDFNPSGIGTGWFINVPSFVNINGDILSNITNTLNSIIYTEHDNRFIAVGNDGVIISAEIGSITSRQFRVDREPDVSYENLNDIVYANDMYVIVGDNGTVGYSYDLMGTWTVSTLSVSNDFNSVTYVNNVFVAVGENGVVANSINGIDWFIKNSVSSSVYSIIHNGVDIVGVGSDSSYFISEQERSDATVTASINNGILTSININDGGFGYVNSSDIQTIASSPTPLYEKINTISAIGDYGKIIGIGTSSVGIGTTSPMLIFSIQSDVGLNTNRIGESTQLNPFIVRSGITTGDYFVAYNTITGSGIISIDTTSGISTVGITTEYLDNVYRVAHINNDGISGVVTVYTNVKSIVGVASTSVVPDKVGFDTTGKVGNYSWGKLYNFDPREDEKTFIASNKNSFSGLSTSPLIYRTIDLKPQYE